MASPSFATTLQRVLKGDAAGVRDAVKQHPDLVREAGEVSTRRAIARERWWFGAEWPRRAERQDAAAQCR
jgi:hypothetical protein